MEDYSIGDFARQSITRTEGNPANDADQHDGARHDHWLIHFRQSFQSFAKQSATVDAISRPIQVRHGSVGRGFVPHSYHRSFLFSVRRLKVRGKVERADSIDGAEFPLSSGVHSFRRLFPCDVIISFSWIF
jgi:hypothetical protein